MEAKFKVGDKVKCDPNDCTCGLLGTITNIYNSQVEVLWDGAESPERGFEARRFIFAEYEANCQTIKQALGIETTRQTQDSKVK